MSSAAGHLFLFKVEVVDHFESMFVKSFDLNLGLLSAFLEKKRQVDLDRGKYLVSFSGISKVLRTSLTCPQGNRHSSHETIIHHTNRKMKYIGEKAGCKVLPDA